MHNRFSYQFRDPALRERALSHRSVGAHNNERLEFFGDALVNLFVAELIYERFPKADEGAMTRMRSRLVSETALAEVARELEIGDHLHLGPGELKTGGFRRDSILADAFEALIAAVYLDGGWEACRSITRELFEARVTGMSPDSEKDAKTRLQETLQARGLPLPIYELTATSGADHAKVFDIVCVIAGIDVRAEGRGNSRRAAEQAAATNALAQIQTQQ